MALDVIHRSSGDSRRQEHLGAYVIEPLIGAAEEGAGTVWRVRIAPGQRTAISYHQVAEEYYFILSGSGLAVLDGRELPIKAGDFLRLPPGTRHSFVTAQEPLEMLDIHTPGCWPQRDTFFVEGMAEQ
jgi:mannose-6-phosphate isomerase-like protein (cupin superfamily)